MKGYIFDLDGTLLDSTGLWGQIDIDFLARRGLGVPPGYVEQISALSFPEAAAYTIKRFGLPDTVDGLLEEWNQMAVKAYGSTVPMKPHAKAYLEILSQRGVPLAIATSLPEALYGPALSQHGIGRYFDAVCSTDQVAHGKSAPDVFLLAAHKLGLPPGDCVLFEDILEAVQSGKAAGMTVYGVLDEASRENWAEIARIADGVLEDFKEAPLPD